MSAADKFKKARTERDSLSAEVNRLQQEVGRWSAVAASARKAADDFRLERDEARRWLEHIEKLIEDHRDRKPGNVLLMVRDALQAALSTKGDANG